MYTTNCIWVNDMVCPWLVKTITQVNNKNSYNDSVKTEHQEFDKCMEYNCPFYTERQGNDTDGQYKIPICKRTTQ